MNEDLIRHAFEEWFNAPKKLERDSNGNYLYMTAHTAWIAYLAGALWSDKQ